MSPACDRPCAAPGLKSYRYLGRYGFVMIGAHDDTDALREAGRSIEGAPQWERLEWWNGERYVPVYREVSA